MQNPISSEATKKQRENVDRTTKDAEETYMWKLKQKGMGPNFGNGRSERQERKRGSIQMACLKQIAAYSRRLILSQVTNIPLNFTNAPSLAQRTTQGSVAAPSARRCAVHPL